MHFNTSHVSINRLKFTNERLLYRNFNTSHVSINLATNKDDIITDINFNTSHFSINQHSSTLHAPTKLYFNTSHVSINRASARSVKEEKPISIHLMFLLIYIWRQTNQVHSAISIHLMFLLIAGMYKNAEGYREFQYISCFY